jgi:hypothetical protein
VPRRSSLTRLTRLHYAATQGGRVDAVKPYTRLVEKRYTPEVSGCPADRPRLLSENGSNYIAGDLAKWLNDRNIKHVRGAPYRR